MVEQIADNSSHFKKVYFSTCSDVFLGPTLCFSFLPESRRSGQQEGKMVLDRDIELASDVLRGGCYKLNVSDVHQLFLTTRGVR